MKKTIEELADELVTGENIETKRHYFVLGAKTILERHGRYELYVWIKNTLLFLLLSVVIIVSTPFYFLWSFGKTLCDKDNLLDFIEVITEGVGRGVKISNAETIARNALHENEILKKKLEKYEQDINKS